MKQREIGLQKRLRIKNDEIKHLVGCEIEPSGVDMLFLLKNKEEIAQ
jgi:hypothetical protein